MSTQRAFAQASKRCLSIPDETALQKPFYEIQSKLCHSSGKVSPCLTASPVVRFRFLPASPLYGSTPVNTKPDGSALGSGPSVFMDWIWLNQRILLHSAVASEQCLENSE
jgi:hypothetical protein